MRASIAGAVLAAAGAATAFGVPRASTQRLAANATTALPPSQDPWYRGVAELYAKSPGEILRVRVAPGNLTGVIANSSAAYQLLYATTDSNYNPSFAVTTLFVPAVQYMTTDNYLLSYQIPYDSADVDSSPSYTLAQGGEPDIAAALGRGWFVSVPDYETELASFTAGVVSGHATLDAVRAAVNSGFGLDPSQVVRTALWGYSGGALASEWAAELQVQYAPELYIVGAALGGLTPNVTSVVYTVSGTPFAGLVPSGILGLSSQFPALRQYVLQNLKTSGPYNATGFLAAQNYTLVQSIGAFANHQIQDYFNNGLELLNAPISKNYTQRDGQMGNHGVPQMPVFAYKAIHDEISVVADTDALVARYCAAGANIWYQRNTIGGHEAEEVNGDARAVAFLQGVFNGSYTIATHNYSCLIQNVTVGTDTSSLRRALLE